MWYHSASWRICASGSCHELLEAGHVLLDERAVERAPPLQLRGERPRQHHVGPGLERDVHVGLLGDLDALGIHHHDLGPVAAGRVDDRGEVEVRPRDVVAPRDREPGVPHLLGGDAGRGAEGAEPGLGADAAAERRAVEERGAQLVEEAQVHRRIGEHAVRPRVVERQHRLRAVRGDHARHALVDEVERLVPGHRREAPLALGADAAQRRLQAPGPVYPLGVRAGDLGADHPGGVGIGARAADLHDLRVLDGHGEAAGVRAIERADARVVAHGSHRKTTCWRVPDVRLEFRFELAEFRRSAIFPLRKRGGESLRLMSYKGRHPWPREEATP